MQGLQRTIAIAEDDQDDRDLMRDAFAEGHHAHRLMFFHDGEELMDYLVRGAEKTRDPVQMPDMVLLDLNMPRLDGRQALVAIRSHPRLCQLPVVVISTSREAHDVLDAYQRGANSFISKPSRFRQLVDALSALDHFWFGIANLPGPVVD